MNQIILFVILLWQVMSTNCRQCTSSESCVLLLDCPELMLGTKAMRESSECNEPFKYCCPTFVKTRITESAEEEDKFPKDCGSTPWYESDRVVGGRVIEPDEFSWLVSLEYADYEAPAGVCAGSIVNSLYVVTAAHCVSDRMVDYFGGLKAVRVGNFTNGLKCDFGTPGCQQYQRIEVDEIIVHPDYIVNSRARMLNDIALVRLQRKIEFTSMLKPICLPFGNNPNIPEPSSTNQLMVSGWGHTSSRRDDLAKRAVSVPLWTRENCLQDVRRDESQICTGVTGKGACHGDSGGPVMYQFESRRFVLEGIVSYGGRECATPTFPSVATRVRSFGNWIENRMRMS
ncbi:phenoloxidase-activating factor 1-like [Drosophila albomicans]|uniref:Phenoloxidase-activating factor 1-like n=1 Tax=Drosophila albomicans TaxID=7291 RepID=A0A6P8XZ48_DROAB|nr:phenoloxidase-activating factor 1-like [Drosophila albomicans]